MEIRPLDESDELWPAFVGHLERVDMARWVIGEDRRFSKEGLHALAVVVGGDVVGHIAFQLRPLVVPETEWSEGRDHAVALPDGAPITETFVATFAVDEEHRRRGHGRALQLAAVERSRELGAWQMRSWSSLDKPANHALKLGLGFAACPTREPWGRDGTDVCGAYFVLPLRAGGL